MIRRILCYLIFGLSGSAMGADEWGNGTDQYPIHTGVAWFGQQRVVTYCVKVSPDFGVDESEVEGMVGQAIVQWQEYFAKIKSGQWINIATIYSNQPCGAQTDLTFFFGVDDQRVVDAKLESGLNSPLAMAYMEEFDLGSLWGRGFIWLSKHGSMNGDPLLELSFPDWSNRKKLYGIILHELGHVFGCAHQRGTIMRPDFERFLKKELSPELEDLLFTRIDQYKTVANCIDCDVTYDGWLHPYYPNNRDEDIFLYQILTGRTPANAVTAKLRIVQNWRERNVKLFYSISDGETVDEFEMNVGRSMTVGRAQIDLPAFSTVRKSDQFYTMSAATGPTTFYTNLKTKTGERLPIVLEFNMRGTGEPTGYPVVMKFIDYVGGGALPLFVPDLPK